MKVLFRILVLCFGITGVGISASFGDGWTPQSSGTTRDLYAVSFVDANTGTAVGGIDYFEGTGIILRTTDGGDSWTPQLLGGDPLRGVSFVDANTGFAFGGAFGSVIRVR